MNQEKAILEAIAALIQGESSSSNLKEELTREEKAEFLIGCIGLTNPFVYQSGKPYVVLKKKGKFYNGTAYLTAPKCYEYLQDVSGSFSLVYNLKKSTIVEEYTNLLEPTYNEFRKSFDGILNKLKGNGND